MKLCHKIVFIMLSLALLGLVVVLSVFSLRGIFADYGDAGAVETPAAFPLPILCIFAVFPILCLLLAAVPVLRWMSKIRRHEEETEDEP